MAFVILYLFKFLHGKQGFCSFGISMCRIFALTFNFKVPTLAVPNEVHCESVQKSSGSLKGHLVRNSQPSLVHVTVVSVMLGVEQLSAKTNRSSEVNCCGHQASKTKTKLWDREEKVTLLITNLSFIYAVNFTRCGRNRNLWQKERGNPREGGGGGYSREFWIGVRCEGSWTLNLLRTKKAKTNTLLSQTLFNSRKKQNIITSMKTNIWTTVILMVWSFHRYNLATLPQDHARNTAKKS